MQQDLNDIDRILKEECITKFQKSDHVFTRARVCICYYVVYLCTIVAFCNILTVV